MSHIRARRPLIIFNVLVMYVLVQLVWWAWLIVTLLHTVYGDTAEYSSKLRMILGEGLVFVVLLVIGIIITGRMFRKEMWINHQQRNFLLSVTHELKTPLASTRLALETLDNRDLSAEKRKEVIQRALDENKRLSNLIENILLSASFENPGFSVHKERADISVIVQQTVGNLAAGVGKHHKVVSQIESGIMLSVDTMVFPSVITNLVENAIKYSKPGSEIAIELKKQQNKIEFIVRDQGIGIDIRNQKRLFDKFFRAQDENTRTVKGTGLGLYLTKIICDHHQFEIRVEKNNPEGSVFRVIMPNQ